MCAHICTYICVCVYHISEWHFSSGESLYLSFLYYYYCEVYQAKAGVQGAPHVCIWQSSWFWRSSSTPLAVPILCRDNSNKTKLLRMHLFSTFQRKNSLIYLYYLFSNYGHKFVCIVFVLFMYGLPELSILVVL